MKYEISDISVLVLEKFLNNPPSVAISRDSDGRVWLEFEEGV